MKPKKSVLVSIGRVVPRRPMPYAPNEKVFCLNKHVKVPYQRRAADLQQGEIIEGLGIVTAVEHRP